MILPLILLLSASDFFPLDWQGWHGGSLRGIPNALSVNADGLHFQMIEQGQDGYPFDSDLTTPLPKPLQADERPLILYHVTLPDFSSWGAVANTGGNRLYLDLRVTAHYQQGKQFWAGIFLGFDAQGQPAYGYRALQGWTRIASIPSFGDWTFGLGLTPDGQLQFYAVQGWTDQPPLVATNDGVADDGYIVQAETISGLYIALRCAIENPGQLSPDWIIRDVKTFAQPHPPALEVSREAQNIDLIMRGGYPSVPATLQKSLDLLDWSDVTAMQNNDVFADAMSEAQQFYRLSSP